MGEMLSVPKQEQKMKIRSKSARKFLTHEAEMRFSKCKMSKGSTSAAVAALLPGLRPFITKVLPGDC